MSYSFGMVFYSLVFSFLIGIAIQSFEVLPYGSVTVMLILSLTVFIIGIAVKRRAVLSSRYFLLSALLISCSLGVIRFHVSEPLRSTILDEKLEQKISLNGTIDDEPDNRDSNVKLFIKIDEVDVVSKVLITVPHYPQFTYGDMVNVTGKLRMPKNFKSDVGREFNYVEYLKKDNVLYEMYLPQVKLLSTQNGNPIKLFLFSLKRKITGVLEDTISEPHSSLMAGLILGVKNSLGKDILDTFRAVGLIHIVVLSGYNISLISDYIMRIFAFLPRTGGAIFGGVGIVLFAIMTGASATIVRASIMALLVICARMFGRTYDMPRALFAAGFIMVVHNPRILIFDPSFQLSFLATLGLIYVSPIIVKYVTWIPDTFGMRDIATSTFAAQVAVMPLIIYMMGEVSLVAFLSNFLVLPIIPLTMLFGFITSVIGSFVTSVAFPFAFISYVLLSYTLTVVNVLSAIPFSVVDLPAFSFWYVLVAYGLMSYWITRVTPMKKLRKVDVTV